MGNTEIAMIIEDGSVVDGANSYVSLDFAEEYMNAHGHSGWADITDEEKKSKLIQATTYIDTMFDWKGFRKTPYQYLAFPREDIVDYDGYEVQGIPKNLKAAVCEASFISTTSELFVNYDANGSVKKQAVDNAVEIEYFGKNDSATNYSTVFEILNKLLKGLYYEKNHKRSIIVPIRRRY